MCDTVILSIAIYVTRTEYAQKACTAPTNSRIEKWRNPPPHRIGPTPVHIHSHPLRLALHDLLPSTPAPPPESEPPSTRWTGRHRRALRSSKATTRYADPLPYLLVFHQSLQPRLHWTAPGEAEAHLGCHVLGCARDGLGPRQHRQRIQHLRLPSRLDTAAVRRCERSGNATLTADTGRSKAQASRGPSAPVEQPGAGTLERPKSATLTRWSAPTSRFSVLKSPCRMPELCTALRAHKRRCGRTGRGPTTEWYAPAGPGNPLGWVISECLGGMARFSAIELNRSTRTGCISNGCHELK